MLRPLAITSALSRANYGPLVRPIDEDLGRVGFEHTNEVKTQARASLTGDDSWVELAPLEESVEDDEGVESGGLVSSLPPALPATQDASVDSTSPGVTAAASVRRRGRGVEHTGLPSSTSGHPQTQPGNRIWRLLFSCSNGRRASGQ